MQLNGLARVWFGLTVGFGAAYVAQMASPLRINNDAIVLLSMAQSAAHGTGFLDAGHPTVFPPVYPAIVALLVTTGLAHAWALVGMNLAALAIGIGAVAGLAKAGAVPASSPWMLAALVLASFVVVKHATVPLTDLVFMAVSMLCLLVMSRSDRAATSRLWVASIVAAWGVAEIAISTRRIGLALLPALVIVTVRGAWRRWPAPLAQRARLVTAALVVIALAASAAVVRATSTLSDLSGTVQDHGLQIVLSVPAMRLGELGEIFVNVPASKLPPAATPLLPVAGVMAAALVIAGLVRQRAWLGPVAIYLAGYTAVLATWPFRDARFWLPVLPLLVVYALDGARAMGDRSIVRMVRPAYLTMVVALGAVALAYSTRVSFAGAAFPDRYGNGEFRDDYCAALGGCTPTAPVNPRVVHILEAYR